jgi:signal transduction histidine kinase
LYLFKLERTSETKTTVEFARKKLSLLKLDIFWKLRTERQQFVHDIVFLFWLTSSQVQLWLLSKSFFETSQLFHFSHRNGLWKLYVIFWAWKQFVWFHLFFFRRIFLKENATFFNSNLQHYFSFNWSKFLFNYMFRSEKACDCDCSRCLEKWCKKYHRVRLSDWNLYFEFVILNLKYRNSMITTILFIFFL